MQVQLQGVPASLSTVCGVRTATSNEDCRFMVTAARNFYVNGKPAIGSVVVEPSGTLVGTLAFASDLTPVIGTITGAFALISLDPNFAGNMPAVPPRGAANQNTVVNIQTHNRHVSAQVVLTDALEPPPSGQGIGSVEVQGFRVSPVLQLTTDEAGSIILAADGSWLGLVSWFGHLGVHATKAISVVRMVNHLCGA